MNEFKLNIIFVYYKVLNIINRLTIKNPNIKSEYEAIDLIVNNRVSVSRFGDGEFAIMRGFENGFQKKDKKLAERLKQVLNSYDKDIIICIPDVFGSLKRYRKESQLFWMEYLDLKRERKEWVKFIGNKVYNDANLTRPYMMYKDKYDCKLRFDKLKSIWNNREIIIVEGEGSRLGVGNDLFNNSKSIERILCPSKNAFDKYEQILKCVKHYCKDKLILIALGPTASILAYDLSRDGYQAIDIGHIDIEYEWFLRGAKQKIKIENKYVNEVKDEKYKQEIINIIK